MIIEIIIIKHSMDMKVIGILEILEEEIILVIDLLIEELIIFMKEVGQIRYLEDLEEEGVVVSNLF